MQNNATPEPAFPEGAALVLGGSGGIGSSICELFARQGADVAITYRNNAKAAEAVAARVATLGRRAAAVRVDTADAKSVERGLKEADDRGWQLIDMKRDWGTVFPQ